MIGTDLIGLKRQQKSALKVDSFNAGMSHLSESTRSNGLISSRTGRVSVWITAAMNWISFEGSIESIEQSIGKSALRWFIYLTRIYSTLSNVIKIDQTVSSKFRLMIIEDLVNPDRRLRVSRITAKPTEIHPHVTYLYFLILFDTRKFIFDSPSNTLETYVCVCVCACVRVCVCMCIDLLFF